MMTLDDVIRTHVHQALMRHRWNKVRTAHELGIGTATLYRYMKKWSIPIKRPLEAG